MRCLMLTSMPRQQIASILTRLVAPIGSVNPDRDQWSPRGFLEPDEAKRGENQLFLQHKQRKIPAQPQTISYAPMYPHPIGFDLIALWSQLSYAGWLHAGETFRRRTRYDKNMDTIFCSRDWHSLHCRGGIFSDCSGSSEERFRESAQLGAPAELSVKYPVPELLPATSDQVVHALAE